MRAAARADDCAPARARDPTICRQMLPGKMLEFPAMKRRTLLQSLPAMTFLPTAAWAASQPKADSASTTVHELRVYHTYEGKLNDLLKRFREHTTKLFEKHGIRNAAYWTAFQDDPEWRSVRDKSEEGGKIVEKVDSTFMVLTDFSPPVR